MDVLSVPAFEPFATELSQPVNNLRRCFINLDWIWASSHISRVERNISSTSLWSSHQKTKASRNSSASSVRLYLYSWPSYLVDCYYISRILATFISQNPSIIWVNEPDHSSCSVHSPLLCLLVNATLASLQPFRFRTHGRILSVKHSLSTLFLSRER